MDEQLDDLIRAAAELKGQQDTCLGVILLS